MSPNRAPDNGRFYELDILRGVAALVVVAYHYVHFYYTDQFQPDLYVDVPFFDLLRPIYQHGLWFVDLFFSISGYVFFWLYSEPIRSGAVSIKSFAVARIARLYPLHLVTLGVTVGLMLLFQALFGYDFVYQGNTLLNFVLNLFLIHQWVPGAVQSFNGPTWSISVELWMYGVFFMFCLWKGGRLALGGMTLIGIIIHLISPDSMVGRALPCFFLGGVAYACVQALTAKGMEVQIRGPGLGLALSGWVISYLFGHEGITGPVTGWVSAVFSKDVFVLVLVPLTLIVLGLWRGEMATKHLKPFVWLGDISYSTYLIHFPLQLLIMIGLNGLTPATKAAVIASPAFFMAFFAVLIGVSIISYGQFEMKARLWLLRRFSPRYRH
ncbi:acyltransferase family protein [Asticcacaulis machinosus]|uniref:Acyltransferase n=1 Tax=Asticcacaulis machinosus TaxID=2984211 RepID=A0ABT5HN16_9CAUL|nr:acyltransferase [Asticcacaulis machinosus]MDC7677644.1 acyltransferase [Asticcacaulis machinosus]